MLKRLKETWECDPIIISMLNLGIAKGSYLEIGCANGWRMDVLKREFGMDCWGIEPSIEAGKGMPRIKIGTADNLPFSEEFDVVSFGFVLYVVDRNDLFKIASEADRVLKEDGHLIIYDFHSQEPRLKENPDCREMLTCKADYGGIFRHHPCYREVYTKVDKIPNDPKSHPGVLNVFKKQMI